VITAYLVRDDITSECVRGALIVGGEMFSVLEPPWKNNKSNISCIPSGKYVCNFMRRSSSGKYKNVYHIQHVGGRFGILIHNGNIVSHTRGCLIIGKRKGWLANRRAVLNSRTALGELADIIGEKPFKLIIVGGQNVR
jgi:Family of unknown function (DUF5675)